MLMLMCPLPCCCQTRSCRTQHWHKIGADQLCCDQASERVRTAEEVEAEQQLRENRAKKAQAKRMSADALGDEDGLEDDVMGDGRLQGGFRGRRERQKRGQEAAAKEATGVGIDMCEKIW